MSDKLYGQQEQLPDDILNLTFQRLGSEGDIDFVEVRLEGTINEEAVASMNQQMEAYLDALPVDTQAYFIIPADFEHLRIDPTAAKAAIQGWRIHTTYMDKGSFLGLSVVGAVRNRLANSMISIVGGMMKNGKVRVPNGSRGIIQHIMELRPAGASKISTDLFQGYFDQEA